MRNTTGNTDRHRHKRARSWPGSRAGTRARYFAAATVRRATNPQIRHAPHRARPSATSPNSCGTPFQTAPHLGTKNAEVGGGGGGERADHDLRPRLHPRHRISADCLEPTAHRISNHGRTHLLTDDETKARRACRGRRADVSDRMRAGTPRASTHDSPIVGAVGQSVRARKHSVRPRAQCDPWRDVPKEWHGPRVYASGHGSRASWRGGDCWAGTCACSWGITPDRMPPERSDRGGGTGLPGRHKSTD